MTNLLCFRVITARGDVAVRRALGASLGRVVSQHLVAFFFNDPATTEIYTVSDTLSLHDALPISAVSVERSVRTWNGEAARRTPLRSEEHTSELQSPDTISYAVFCLKKKINT